MCQKYHHLLKYIPTHTHAFLDTVSLSNKSLRPNLKFGQWSACICRCVPCWTLGLVQSSLVHLAKQWPTDIETMCDKMSQTTNMTSLGSRYPWIASQSSSSSSIPLLLLLFFLAFHFQQNTHKCSVLSLALHHINTFPHLLTGQHIHSTLLLITDT